MYIFMYIWIHQKSLLPVMSEQSGLDISGYGYMYHNQGPQFGSGQIGSKLNVTEEPQIIFYNIAYDRPPRVHSKIEGIERYSF